MGLMVNLCSRPARLLLVCWCLSGLVVGSALGSTNKKPKHFKWEVEYMYWKPDCVENMVLGINGQFPGPTIRAVAGDKIIVELTNKLHTEGVVIHWHGIRQFGTPWADGTASISQCAINPGETFNYTFTVDKAGTYFYHGHYGMQRSAGLYGSLIVEVGKEKKKKEPFEYDEEISLLLSDWWHKSVHEQEVGLSSKPFRWIGEPQTLLINGRGQYGCSLAASDSESSLTPCDFTEKEQCKPQILNVKPNKIYRLRLASTTALSSLNLAIQNHKMLVVEADGNYLKNFTVNSIDIYSGESYSVLFRTDQDPTKNYWISVNVIGRKPETPQALTILAYNNPSTSTLPPLPPLPPREAPIWDDNPTRKSFAKNLRSLHGKSIPPKTHRLTPTLPEKHHHRRIILLNTQNNISGSIKWAINYISLTLPTTPYLGALKYNLLNAFDKNPPPENLPDEKYDVMKPPVNPNFTYSSGVYSLTSGQTIDVILQNANALAINVSEIHPWHLHGHDFWVLGYGEGRFNENSDEAKFNLDDPPLKNTAVIFPYGWTALRFIADNPGVWAFHCHIEPHLHMGMGVVFAEAVHNVKNIPAGALACGLTGKKFVKNGN